MISVSRGACAYPESFDHGIQWYMKNFTSPIHKFTVWEPVIIHNIGAQYASM